MKNNKIIIIILLIIIIILLYLLILKLGNIENNAPNTPTGNIDIFEINTDLNNNSKEEKENKTDDKNNIEQKNNKESITQEKKQQEIQAEIFNTDKSELDTDLIVEDDDSIWSERELRIFSNPAYEYQKIIAPGSSNSYTFVVRNNNTFDITVDIIMTEENPSNVNMKYKLRNQGNYIVGNNNKYEDVEKLNIKNITIPAKNQKSYILDWKWVDSENDTNAGIDINNIYKLKIKVELVSTN